MKVERDLSTIKPLVLDWVYQLSGIQKIYPATSKKIDREKLAEDKLSYGVVKDLDDKQEPGTTVRTHIRKGLDDKGDENGTLEKISITSMEVNFVVRFFSYGNAEAETGGSLLDGAKFSDLSISLMRVGGFSLIHFEGPLNRDKPLKNGWERERFFSLKIAYNKVVVESIAQVKKITVSSGNGEQATLNVGE